MSVLGSWNFTTKPTGLWRHVLRLPVWLFRWRLGFLLGGRFVMIDHVGRRSGVVHQTVVEVVEHDEGRGELIVCSGTGPRADWYLTCRPNRHRRSSCATGVGVPSNGC